MGISGSDVAASVAMAVAIVIAYIAWVAYVRPADIAGFWASADGGLYEIRPARGAGRAFDVRGAGAGAACRVRGLRVLEGRTADGREVAGEVAPGGDRVRWSRGQFGGTWWRQGVSR